MSQGEGNHSQTAKTQSSGNKLFCDSVRQDESTNPIAKSDLAVKRWDTALAPKPYIRAPKRTWKTSSPSSRKCLIAFLGCRAMAVFSAQAYLEPRRRRVVAPTCCTAASQDQCLTREAGSLSSGQEPQLEARRECGVRTVLHAEN